MMRDGVAESRESHAQVAAGLCHPKCFLPEIIMTNLALHLSRVVAGLLMLVPSFAQAEVSIQGAAEAVHLETKNASIEEVLGVLRDAYGLTWRSNIPLGRQVS